MRTIADISSVLKRGFIIRRTNGKGTFLAYWDGLTWTQDREAARIYSEDEALQVTGYIHKATPGLHIGPVHAAREAVA